MLAFVIVVGFVLMVVGLLVGRRMWAIHNWRAVARETGLRFRGAFDKPLKISGDYRGVSLQIRTQKPGLDEDENQHTYYRAELPDTIPARLELHTKSFFSAGTVDDPVELEDEQLARTFVVSGDDPDAVRRWLRGDIGEALLEMYQYRSDMSIESGELTFRDSGLEMGENELLEYLEAMADCVQTIERHVEEHEA